MIDPIAENRVAIAGRLLGRPQVRYSPAGIPIARFALEHYSEQPEASVLRRQAFRIGVRAVGEELCNRLASLEEGCSVRVFGFLARSDQASEDYRLLVYARTLTVLDDRQNQTGA
ncbi:primosomal replication protein N [Alkalilimnicola ehrlichii]|uniref:Primosomal replication protein N n=1 Tax=Alkalilimnicola ehrlichii TaxID=351052 RepID=A0A3E0WYG6_9GAMM|nr:primosomal replication protein N [Alkalilimnicola ehrlichii]RFA30471.1 primosomal replication protein N [Alkalilimnicola ehrlichii]RFA38022.1 primosomal replication protein N [Alkalilimnicola ehrlichii]